MAHESLAEQVKLEIKNLQSSVKEMQSSAQLTDIRDRVEDLGRSVSGLEGRIKDLREKGYAFEKDLENQTLDFARDWARKAPALVAEIERGIGQLGKPERRERDEQQQAAQRKLPRAEAWLVLLWRAHETAISWRQPRPDALPSAACGPNQRSLTLRVGQDKAA